MKKIFYKILFLLILFSFFISPVHAEDNQNPESPVQTSNPYSGLEDLGSIHIQMDSDQNVSIKEISDIRKGGQTGIQDAWNFTFTKYKTVITGVTGVCTITFVLIFLITFVKISSSTSNPHQRAELTKALIWIGIGGAGFGAATLFLSIGFGLFKS